MRMRSSRGVIAYDCQCLSRNSTGFDPSTSDTTESEGRQMKQFWIKYQQKRKKPLFEDPASWCNGRSAFCDLAFNEFLFAGSHNAGTGQLDGYWKCASKNQASIFSANLRIIMWKLGKNFTMKQCVDPHGFHNESESGTVFIYPTHRSLLKRDIPVPHFNPVFRFRGSFFPIRSKSAFPMRSGCRFRRPKSLQIHANPDPDS
jgi:hypothetical protein